MSNNKYAGYTIDDIVFEGRNKEYGAYEMRKTNPQNAAISTGIAVSLFVIFIFISGINSNKETLKLDPVIVELTPEEFILPIPPVAAQPIPLPPPSIAPKASQIKSLEMNVVKDELVEEKKILTQEELLNSDKLISDENFEGAPHTKSPIVEPQAPNYGNGPLVAKEPEPKSTETEVFTIVQEMPEFPGGKKALSNFLASVIYPEIALENGMEDKIVVEFIVEKDGSISNVKAVKGQYDILKNAAVNHIKKMPRWKPGKQRDNPARVKIMAPMNFSFKN